jgi:hypothetical protein
MLTSRSHYDGKMIKYVNQAGHVTEVRFRISREPPVRQVFVANGVLMSYILDNYWNITDAREINDSDTTSDFWLPNPPVYEDGYWYIIYYYSVDILVVKWRHDGTKIVLDNISTKARRVHSNQDYIYYGGRVRRVTNKSYVDDCDDIVLPLHVNYKTWRVPIKVRSFGGSIRLMMTAIPGDRFAIGEWCMQSKSIIWIHVHRGSRDCEVDGVIFVADNVVQYMMRMNRTYCTWHYYNITDDTQYDLG